MLTKSKRSSSKDTADTEEENISKKPQFIQKDPTQWLFFINGEIIEQSGNEENEPVVCPLRHPKSDQKALFLFTHGDASVYEVAQFKEEFRSWFIGNTVQHDGSLYMTTPVDPVFLVLPYLIKCGQESGKFMPLDQIIIDPDYPECCRLPSCRGMSELLQVTDVKGDEDFKAYRYNEEKTLSWLKLKTEKVSDMLETKNISTSGAYSGTFIKSTKDRASKDEYLRYAHGIVSDYLPVELGNRLREHLGIPVLVEKRPTDADNPPAKRTKLEDMMPSEDYSKHGKPEDKSAKMKMTTAQKKLSQVDKSGMRSLTSFFSPKSKT